MPTGADSKAGSSIALDKICNKSCASALVNFIFASCGSCPGDVPPVKKPSQEESIVNTLVMAVPNDGVIDGLVMTSCGKCNFGTKDNRCDLSVKIGEQLFPVKGTSFHDHGDAHADDGFCSTIRTARVKGKIVEGRFKVESFELIK